MAADAGDICYSIAVPVFNEEAVLPGRRSRTSLKKHAAARHEGT
jgi:hypothetical protein